MRGTKNILINNLWEESLPNIHSKMLREISTKSKLINLLEGKNTDFEQRKLKNWALTIIDVTENNFNTFAFTKLHYKLACNLYDYMSSSIFEKYKSEVSIFWICLESPLNFLRQIKEEILIFGLEIKNLTLIRIV